MVLVLVVLLLAIDATVLYLAVPSLTEDISPTATEILWIGDIYGFVLSRGCSSRWGTWLTASVANGCC